MAWDSLINDNQWISNIYGEWTFISDSDQYADSYSNLTYDMRHYWDANSCIVSDLNIISDSRYPIYILLLNDNGERATYLTPVSPLYSSTFDCHIILNSVEYYNGTVNMDYYPLDEMKQGYPGCYPFSYQNVTPQYGEIITNMPILAADYQHFEDSPEGLNGLISLRSQYMNNGDLSIFDGLIEDGHIYIFNSAQPPTEEDGQEFTIYNTAQKDLWKESGRTRISGPYYRWVRVKYASTELVDGRLAFYRKGLEDGAIKLIPVSGASIVSCEYSTNGGTTWEESLTFPFEYIYGERNNELGEFISATRTGIGGATGVPLFASRELAEGWVNHDPNVSIDMALNYSDLVNRYGIDNPTGIDELSTTMGSNSNLESLFSQKLLCRKADIAVIRAGLFDTVANFWEDIKKGLEMMGEKPIDSVCGLMYFPVDLSQIFPASSQSYVYFGGYQFVPTDHGLSAISPMKVTNYSGYIDLGTFTVERAFSPAEDVRNFEPYCNMSIYLPYVGMQNLAYNKYVGKTVKVRYYIDLNTGGCLACLFANDILMDYFNGQMGVQLPITLTDYAGFASAELQNISNLAGVGINAGGSVVNAAGGNVTGAVGGAVSSIGGFEKSIYDLSTTSISNFNQTKGGSSAIGNGYLPQYVYVIFEYIQTDESSNLMNLAGHTSNASGSLNSFSGYLEVDDIELRTSAGMTNAEKAEFISMLHSGIII